LIKIIRIERFAYTDEGVFGTLYNEGFYCSTLENPWLNNRQYISCIPSGVYRIRRGDFKGRYPNFELLKVPNRWAIEFHRGNTIKDTMGCILVGEQFRIDQQYNKYWITKSTITMDKFMHSMSNFKEAILVIKSK